MTFEETIAKSRVLDAVLRRGVEEAMPITGVSADIKGLLGGVRKAMEDVKGCIAAELQGMARDIAEHGNMVLSKVKEERKAVVAEFAEMLGNEHPNQTDDEAGKPPGDRDANKVGDQGSA